MNLPIKKMMLLFLTSLLVVGCKVNLFELKEDRPYMFHYVANQFENLFPRETEMVDYTILEQLRHPVKIGLIYLGKDEDGFLVFRYSETKNFEKIYKDGKLLNTDKSGFHQWSRRWRLGWVSNIRGGCRPGHLDLFARDSQMKPAMGVPFYMVKGEFQDQIVNLLRDTYSLVGDSCPE